MGRLCALILLVVCVFAAIWWVARIRFEPDAVYRGIPANAMFFSTHRNLPERWSQLSSNPALKQIVSYVRLFLDFRPPAMEETVFAFVPALGGSGESAWLMSSWVGRQSLLLRWAMLIRRVPGFRKLNTCNSRIIWGYAQPVSESGLRLSVAFGEGVLLACISRDPEGVRQALLAYDGLAPALSAADLVFDPEFSQTPDKGWVKLFIPSRGSANPVRVSYALSRIDARSISAVFRAETNVLSVMPLAAALEVDRAGLFLGELPTALLILPHAMAGSALSASAAPFWARTFGAALKSDALAQSSNFLAIATLTDEYGGGIGREPFRMKIPAITLFTRAQQPDAVKGMVSRSLDALNARYKLGLIIDPTPLPAGRQSVFMLETTRSNILTNAETEDRPAFAVAGDWFLLSSNAGSLAKLLQRPSVPGAPAGSGKPDWRRQLDDRGAAALFWMDLDSGGRTLQLALSVALLRLRSEPESVTSAAVPAVIFFKSWLDDVRPLKYCAIWLEAAASAPTVHLEMGE